MSKIIDLRASARTPAPRGAQPAWESTLVETLGIRKFIEMSIADIKQQLEVASKDGTPRPLFKAQKQNAYVITAWLTSALITVDSMLGEAAARSSEPLADQLTEPQGAA